jgi:hypothetical protein
MDFGLNNVIRKSDEEIDESAHMLIAGLFIKLFIYNLAKLNKKSQEIPMDQGE